MHPILFEIGGFPVYTYGLLLAAAYLLGLAVRAGPRAARGLDRNRVMDLGIWIIISALVGAKLLLLIVDFDKFGWIRSELVNLVRSGGVFYGGLIAAVVVALFYLWRHRMPVWTVDRRLRAGHRARPRHRAARLPVRRLLLRPADGRALGDHVHSEFAAQNVGTPLGIPLHPTQLYEAGAELLILACPARHRARGRPFPGPDVLELHAPVRRSRGSSSSSIAAIRADDGFGRRSRRRSSCPCSSSRSAW